MKVFFSTVVRYTAIKQAGECVCVDWEKKEVKHKTPIYPTNPVLDDPNPRGNTRGGRGIAQMEDNIIVSSYHTLKVYDQNMQHLSDITHPLMVDIHEILPEDKGHLWVTSCALDALFLYNLKHNEVVREYWPREMVSFQKRWGLIPLELDKQADNRSAFYGGDRAYIQHPSHTHLNAVARWNGETYALLPRFSSVVNLDTGEIVIEHEELYRGHNLIINDDGLAFVNATHHQAVHVYDLRTGELKKRINLLPFHWIGWYTRVYDRLAGARKELTRLTSGRYRSKIVRPFFVRGMDLVDDLLFVGISPASILCIDWKHGKLVGSFRYSSDILNSVHGLKVFSE